MPEATAELIASLGEHRILSTAQVRAIHFSDRSSRRAQQVLAYLERAGLVAYVEARRAPRRLYFLTERGADLAIDASEVERRPKVLSPEQAAGPLCAHTIGVNESGSASWIDTLIKLASALGVRIDCALLAGMTWTSGERVRPAGTFMTSMSDQAADT